MSDLHGEYEAFMHILNNCSGVVREQVDEIFGDELTSDRKASSALIITRARRSPAARPPSTPLPGTRRTSTT